LGDTQPDSNSAMLSIAHSALLAITSHTNARGMLLRVAVYQTSAANGNRSRPASVSKTCGRFVSEDSTPLPAVINKPQAALVAASTSRTRRRKWGEAKFSMTGSLIEVGDVLQ
jgi:hypothetical protein